MHAPSELPPQPLLTLPAGQVVHSEHASEPDEVLYFPVPQEVHAPADVPLHPVRYFPAGQPAHVMQLPELPPPQPLTYVPENHVRVEHDVQASEPEDVLYFPAPQEVHAPADVPPHPVRYFPA